MDNLIKCTYPLQWWKYFFDRADIQLVHTVLIATVPSCSILSEGLFLVSHHLNISI